jgi:hypothetical protein
MKTLSRKTIEEVKLILPEVRKKIKLELAAWGKYPIPEAFYSDEQVIEILPYAVRDYIILSLHVDPQSHIEPDKVIDFLNTRLLESLPVIISHALRMLAIPRNN